MGKTKNTNINKSFKSNKKTREVEQPSRKIIVESGQLERKESNSSPKRNKLSNLQMKFAKKLEGARFRTINERLYTYTGKEAFEEFQNNPEKFEIYHQGFREQASQWPINPLDKIINWIKENHRKARVADMGCGDARLSESVPPTVTVYSFDLVSIKPNVIACDIAHVPLQNQSVDIVVFCLSLMGININEFIMEAHRILVIGGILKIVEVKSRFDDEGGNGIKKFIRFLKKAGFDAFQSHSTTDLGNNKMFFDVQCTKTDRLSIIDEDFFVKACVYKKR
eukprot:gene6210-8555_t